MTFMMRPSVSGPTGTVIGAPVSIDLLAADEAVGRVHGDGAHRVLAQMLRHLEHQALALVLGVQRVQDGGRLAVELHVDDGAQHLGDRCRLAFFAMERSSPSPIAAAYRRLGAGDDLDQFLGDLAPAATGCS